MDDIRKQIIDSDIEFICNSSSWALFRKDTAKGSIHIYADNYLKYTILMKKYKSTKALGVCYMCLCTSQIALAFAVNSLFRLSSELLYLCSFMFFIAAYSFKKYSLEYDNGSYVDRTKKEK